MIKSTLSSAFGSPKTSMPEERCYSWKQCSTATAVQDGGAEKEDTSETPGQQPEKAPERELQNNSHRRVSPLVVEAELVAGPLGGAGAAKGVAGQGTK